MRMAVLLVKASIVFKFTVSFGVCVCVCVCWNVGQ